MLFKSVALNQRVTSFLAGENGKMADEIRKIGIFAAAGILVAVLIIAGVMAGGIHLPSLRLPSSISESGTSGTSGGTLDKGTLIIKLTDAPVELKHLNVTIDSISAHSVEHGWQNLTFVQGVSSVSVDILSLYNVTKDLSITEVLPGNYTKLRLTIASAKAVYNITGEVEDVKVPSGRIDIIVHFKIKAGQTTRLLVDMQGEWVAISNSGKLRPVLKATAKEILGE